MKTLDLRKKYKPLYQPSARQIDLVVVPEFQFLMLDGQIEKGQSPGTSPAFQEAMGAIYGAAYTLKFMSKQRKTNAIDFPVMPLEALWWVEDGQFDITRPDNWYWRAMILQPDHITSQLFADALEKLHMKKPSPALELLRLQKYAEGLSVQTMHIGPYATEPGTVARMQTFAAEHTLAERHDHAKKKGYTEVFDHHEIYLGDPRKAAPEKLKTVLRHPVLKKK
jgi:hypothetical protein